MNAVESQPLDSTSSEAKPPISGKLVIIGLVMVAFAGASASWIFRYKATHRAAEYWGPAASLIRDAPIVEFNHLIPPPDSFILGDGEFSGTLALEDPKEARNVSFARGLAHLRNALLEDRSYIWPPRPPHPQTRWPWELTFRSEDGKHSTILLCSRDCTFVARFDPGAANVISSEPIAAGLREMFAEFSSNPLAKPAAQSR
jgi:hypothetical protein